MMVSLFPTRATAAEPVPAMISPPSAPAWAPQGGFGRDEIDVYIRRSAGRLREQLALGVAQSGPGTGGAAIDAKIEGAPHAALTDFHGPTIAAAATRSASAALAGVIRFALAPGVVCPGVAGKCTKTAGIAKPWLARYWSAPK